jgi:hypothetical protein
MPASLKPMLAPEELELGAIFPLDRFKYEFPIQYAQNGRAVIAIIMKAHAVRDYEGMDWYALQLDLLDIENHLGVPWEML